MKSILYFVDDIYEDLELWYPLIRMKEEGYKPVVAGHTAGHVFKGKHGYPCTADISFDEVDVKKVKALVIPGGYASDKIRRYSKALQTVREFNEQNKPIAFICHAGWVPISAKILNGRKVTSFFGIKDDMENAGAIWQDSSVVVDQNLITSRNPGDLPDFCKALISRLSGNKR